MSDEVCDGTGWVVVNPEWPKGAKPYRERCDGCSACRPEDYR